MTILIPIDFSEHALKAARYGLTHFKGANFELLHIVSVRHAGATMAVNINRDLQKYYQKKMNQTVTALSKAFKGVKLKGKVETGLFSETILAEIEHCKADFLILGTKGADSLDEVLLGSNAYLAIRNSTVPLLVINPDHSMDAPKRILLASDFDGGIGDEVVKPLIDFKNRFNAEMEVLHVRTQEEISDKLKINPLIDNEVNRFHIIESERIENAIVDFADKDNFDFIALIPRYRGIIQGLFHKSITKRISAKATTSLFILK